MIFLFILLGIIVTVLIILPFLPVKIAVTYCRKNKDDKFQIEVEALFGLINYCMEISYVKLRRKLLTPILDLRASFLGAKGKKDKDEVKEQFGLHSLDLETLIEKLKFLIHITDQYEALIEMMKTFRREEKHDQEIRMENVVIYRVMAMLVMGLQGECKKLIWHTRYGTPDAAVTAVLNGLVWTVKSAAISALSHYCTFKTRPEVSVTPDFDTVGVDIQFESIFSVRIGNIMSNGFRILLREYKRRAKHRWPIIQLKQ